MSKGLCPKCECLSTTVKRRPTEITMCDKCWADSKLYRSHRFVRSLNPPLPSIPAIRPRKPLTGQKELF